MNQHGTGSMEELSPARQRRMRTLLLSALFVQLVLAGIGLASVVARDSNPVSFVKPEVIASTATPIDAETGLPIAEAYARQWSDEIRLIAVTMRLDWEENDPPLDSTDLPGRGWIIYVFENDGQTLSLYLDRGTGILIGQNESSFGGNSWPTLDLATYPRSSSITALTANITAGAEYREACPQSRKTAIVTASSWVSDDEESRLANPVWTVTFGDGASSGTFDVLVRMNAISGEVVTSEVRERSCEV